MRDDNEHRAECAETAVRAYAAVKEHNATDCCDFSSEDAQERLTDLLADLRHLCRREGIDFADAVRTSAMHFEAEEADADVEAETDGPRPDADAPRPLFDAAGRQAEGSVRHDAE